MLYYVTCYTYAMCYIFVICVICYVEIYIYIHIYIYIYIYFSGGLQYTENPEEVGSNASEEMDLLLTGRTSVQREEDKVFLS